jgi:hypothetical protein
MKQVKNQVYLTEGSLPIDPGRTTMEKLCPRQIFPSVAQQQSEDMWVVI